MLLPSVLPSATHIDFHRAYQNHPGLMNEVTRYDKQLVVYYDSAVCRWGLARLTPGGLRFIALWEDPTTKEYRPLDRRFIAWLANADLRPERLDAHPSADAKCRADEYEDELRERRQWAGFRDDMGHATRENKRQLLRAFGNYLNR